jgi:glycosyltransferase involved in cell wall biosynthesis
MALLGEEGEPLMTFTLTVVICTAGERQSLQNALESIVAQELLDDTRLELLIVDNSVADTGFVEHIVAELARGAPLVVRTVREPKPGLGYARNAGIATATGQYLAFLDDDAVASPRWVAALVRAHRETGAAVVGGPIRPGWQAARPAWLGDELLGFLGVLNQGPARQVCHYPRYPFGGNISFEVGALRRLGGFAEQLSGGGAPTFLMDEIEVCQRFEAAGEVVLYEPEASVQHQVPPARLTRAFFWKRAAVVGRATARMWYAEGRLSWAAWARAETRGLGRTLRHSIRALGCLVGHRERDFVSEARHVVWNAAWMWESALIYLTYATSRGSSRNG